MKKICSINNKIITVNYQVNNEYFIEELLEVGLSLQGWEVKSLRLGKIDISNSYIYLQENNAYLFNSYFQPVNSPQTFELSLANRNRNILLKKREYNYLYGKIKRKGYTLVAYSLYWKNNWCKLQIALGKGKKIYDKRYSIKQREWQIKKNRLIKQQQIF
ncbi:MAG: SsrA-binding protein SmpB [Candidatus Dasytiphilus stammeri]